MTWTNPPQSLIDARDTLLQSATVTATVLPALTLGQRQARCHYPRGDGRSDSFPMFVFRREKYSAKRMDAIGYGTSGTVTVHLYVADATVDDGTLEGWAEAIIQDLVSMGATETGIQYIISAECGEAVEPNAAQLAAAVAGQIDEQGCTYRVISITWEWEC